jgi:hypothetical protein
VFSISRGEHKQFRNTGASREDKLESHDMKAVFNFAEHVILNAGWLWTELVSDASRIFKKGSLAAACAREEQVVVWKLTCYSMDLGREKIKEMAHTCLS